MTGVTAITCTKKWDKSVSAHEWVLYEALGKNLKNSTEDVVHWFKLLQDSDLAKLLPCKNVVQEWKSFGV